MAGEKTESLALHRAHSSLGGASTTITWLQFPLRANSLPDGRRQRLPGRLCLSFLGFLRAV